MFYTTLQKAQQASPPKVNAFSKSFIDTDHISTEDILDKFGLGYSIMALGIFSDCDTEIHQFADACLDLISEYADYKHKYTELIECIKNGIKTCKQLTGTDAAQELKSIYYATLKATTTLANERKDGSRMSISKTEEMVTRKLERRFIKLFC